LVKFEGLCCVCFEPIRRGEGFQFSEDGRKFHRLCVETFPFSHYVKLDMIELLSEKDVPNDIKVTWNRYLEDAIT